LENRTALRGAGTSKWIVALFALIVVLGLGVMAAYIAKGVSAPAATHTNIVSTESGRGCPHSQLQPAERRQLRGSADQHGQR